MYNDYNLYDTVYLKSDNTNTKYKIVNKFTHEVSSETCYYLVPEAAFASSVGVLLDAIIYDVEACDIIAAQNDNIWLMLERRINEM